MKLEYLEYLSNKSSNLKQLVIMLHGYGSDASNLISLAPELAKYLPNADFICPNGPSPCELNKSAHQWFSLTIHEDPYMTDGAKVTAKILNQFIDEQIDRFKIKSSDVALVGFSQGAMMSLYTGLRRENAVNAILGYSGMMLSPHLLKDEIKSKPKVMLIHGAEDQTLTPSMMHLAKEALEDNGIDCRAILREKLGHGIDARGIEFGGNFLKEVFQVSSLA